MSDSATAARVPRSRPCELCGRAGPALVFEIDGYRVVRCHACSLVFVGNPPDDESLAALYDEAYWEAPETPGYTGYEAQAERKRHHFRTLLARMESFLDPGRLFEIGCAYGFFLDEARGRGWSVSGVEPSPSAASHAKDVLRLDVHAGPVESAPFSPASFDAVVMWDVIEHLSAPLRTLRTAEALLRPGGLLALSIGDVASLSARLQGRHWSLYTPPWHLFFFSSRTLSKAIEAVGLELLSLDGDGIVGPDPMAPRQRLPGWASQLLAGRSATAIGRALGFGMIKYLFARKPVAEGGVG